MMNRTGLCQKSCGNNEVYNSVTGNCDCYSGLGRLNGVCQICPSNFALSADGNCIICGANQKLVSGKCVCVDGFIPNERGLCVSCTSRPGAFLVNGKCATCPGELTYDGTKCSCPVGSTRVGTKCKQSCSNDQLID